MRIDEALARGDAAALRSIAAAEWGEYWIDEADVGAIIGWLEAPTDSKVALAPMVMVLIEKCWLHCDQRAKRRILGAILTEWVLRLPAGGMPQMTIMFLDCAGDPSLLDDLLPLLTGVDAERAGPLLFGLGDIAKSCTTPEGRGRALRAIEEIAASESPLARVAALQLQKLEFDAAAPKPAPSQAGADYILSLSLDPFLEAVLLPERELDDEQAGMALEQLLRILCKDPDVPADAVDLLVLATSSWPAARQTELHQRLKQADPTPASERALSMLAAITPGP